MIGEHKRFRQFSLLQFDCEALEQRLVLTSLSALANGALAGAPELLNSGTLSAPHRADVVNSDLEYLVANQTSDQLSRLDRVGSSLLTLHSRSLQGASAKTSDNLLNGSSYEDAYLAKNGVPHVQVYVREVAIAQRELTSVGMEITAVNESPSWNVIAGYLPVDQIGAASGTSGLIYLLPSDRPFLNTGQTDSVGSGDNEWDEVSRADQLRRVLPSIDGSGIDIGVISDSIDQVGAGIAASQATGDLPGNSRITVLQDTAGDDEGRAMAELIYDLGTGFDFLYHTGFISSADMAQGIIELAAAGADVIVDDISYAGEPFFQDGQIAQAIDNAYLNYDALYFNSAGNGNGESFLRTWSSSDGDDFLNFTSSDETVNVTLQPDQQLRIFLQWDNPWGNGDTAFDIELYDSSLTTKLADSNDSNLGGLPFDALNYTNTSSSAVDYHLAFRHTGGNDPSGRILRMLSFTPASAFTDTYTDDQVSITGNHASRYGFAIGAVPWFDPDNIESFSSHGTVEILFDDFGNRLSSPITRLQPKFTAADGTETTVPGFENFFGTSAAAPNAAAVVGLMMQAAGGAESLTWTETRDILRATAVGTGTGSWDPVHGYGRIDALGAGLVSAGKPSEEFYVELNPFGDASVDNDLFDNDDLDRFLFAADNSGTTTVSVFESDSIFDAGLIQWDADSGSFIELDYDDGPNDDPVINFSADRWDRYQFTVFSESDVTSAGSTDFTLTIDAPDATISSLSVSAGSPTSVSFTISDGDADYFSFTAPTDDDLTLMVDNITGGLDPVLTLFDEFGDELERVDIGGGGASETLTFTGIVAGVTYYARVGAYHYASSGDYDFTVSFGEIVPPTLDVSYFSLQIPRLLTSSNGSTLFADDSDIVSITRDGAEFTFAMVFDGSDVGLTTGGEDVDAFSMLPDGSLLISTLGTANVDGERFFDEDVLRFVPSSLGENTSGTLQLLLDGSDIGLNTGAEDVVAISANDDGDFLISTLSRAVVPGQTALGQDVLRFSPTSTGNDTAGTWSLELRGSSMGLTTGSERIDAIASPDGTIEMSVIGRFVTNTIAGFDEDVFASDLILDGSENGLAFGPLDIDAWHRELPGTPPQLRAGNSSHFDSQFLASQSASAVTEAGSRESMVVYAWNVRLDAGEEAPVWQSASNEDWEELR